MEWDGDQYIHAKSFIIEEKPIEKDDILQAAGIKQIFNSYVFQV